MHCELKTCLLDALEGCSQVGDKVGIIGCKADVVHVLSTPVRLDYFIEVFPHEAGNCGKLPTKALYQTTVCRICVASRNRRVRLL